MRYLRPIILIFFGLFLIFFIATDAHATQIRSSQGPVSIGASEIINDEVIITGSDVIIKGKIVGDLIVFGGNVDIIGQIQGNVLVFGGTVKISGLVTGSVRGIFGSLQISGRIAKNVTAAVGNLQILPTAVIEDNVIALAGNINFFGQIGHQLKALAGAVKLAGKISDSVTLITNSATLTSNASISGDLILKGNQPASIQKGAQILGQTIFHYKKSLWPQAKPSIQILKVLSYFLVALLVTLLLPRFSDKVANKVFSKFWLSLGLGALFVFLVPLITLILVLAVVTAPIGVLIGLWYGICLYLAKIFVAIVLGRLILSLVEKKSISLVWGLILGLAIILLLIRLPVIGGLISFVVSILGFGALILAKKDTWQEIKTRKLI